MIRIESRPACTGRRPCAFFIDVEGHVDEGAVRQALSEPGGYAAMVKEPGPCPVALP